MDRNNKENLAKDEVGYLCTQIYMLKHTVVLKLLPYIVSKLPHKYNVIRQNYVVSLQYLFSVIYLLCQQLNLWSTCTAKFKISLHNYATDLQKQFFKFII